MQAININLGCGDRYVPGWTNVDLIDMPHKADQRVDLIHDVLPWENVDSIYAGHLLEHMQPWEALRLLAKLREVTVPGGAIMVVGPDVEVAFQMIQSGEEMYTATMESLRYGAGRWAGDVHYWACTERALTVMLELAGWTAITPVPISEAALTWPVADPRPQWQAAVGASNGIS
jgi:hypothetical protein